MNAQELAPNIEWEKFPDEEAYVMLLHPSNREPTGWTQDGCHGIDSDLDRTIQILNHGWNYRDFYILAVFPSSKWSSFSKIGDDKIAAVLNEPRNYDPMLANMVRAGNRLPPIDQKANNKNDTEEGRL